MRSTNASRSTYSESDTYVPEADGVSEHAARRYLERIDGTEPYPRSTIRRQAREARPVDLDDPRFQRARRHPESGVVYVLDTSGTVTTCLRPAREQLPASEQRCSP